MTRFCREVIDLRLKGDDAFEQDVQRLYHVTMRLFEPRESLFQFEGLRCCHGITGRLANLSDGRLTATARHSGR